MPHEPGYAGVVAAALLELGRSGRISKAFGDALFATKPEANQLIIADPFAFLLGVLFDQGIAAEKAWAAPYELRNRLGNLSPARMSVQRAEIEQAIKTPPMLHRFPSKMSGWVWSTADIVNHTYHGDAGAIWSGTPTAREVQDRLIAFPGIGQKKAAMAVEILESKLGVAIGDMQGSDIAYDVHVRRVFLRSGLARVDKRDHMIAVAREANPDRPGEIDLPAWWVGRTWCHPQLPRCGECPIASACRQDIAAANGVRGI